MKRPQVVLYFVIFVIGFAMGWYAVLFLQNQITLATIGSVIVTAIGAWLIVRLDLVKLLLDIRTEKKEEERRQNSVIYAQVDPILAEARRELYLAREAYEAHNSVNYAAYMNGFQAKMHEWQAADNLRHVSTNALNAFKELELVQRGIHPRPPGLVGYGNLIEDEQLASQIQRTIVEIDAWRKEWDKWRTLQT